MLKVDLTLYQQMLEDYVSYDLDLNEPFEKQRRNLFSEEEMGVLRNHMDTEEMFKNLVSAQENVYEKDIHEKRVEFLEKLKKWVLQNG